MLLFGNTPFFIGRTHFVPQISEYGNGFDQEAYIIIVAQKTTNIRKLFIFLFSFDNQKYILDENFKNE